MDVASTFSLSGVFNIFADGEDLQGGHHSRPAGGALVAGDDEADGAEPNGQRLAVLAVDEQDRPAVEGVVKLGEREDNVVVVAAMDQHNQAQLLASELFAELDPGPGQWQRPWFCPRRRWSGAAGERPASRRRQEGSGCERRWLAARRAGVERGGWSEEGLS